MAEKKSGLTPLMQQYFSLKAEYEGILLLFQVGDFYELFFEDAKIAAQFLNITLTKRGECDGEPIPLCGFPMHAKDHYITKLVRGGFKVALCDQLEPATTGKMVARGVTSVLTPGTLTADAHLDPKSASFLLSFFPTKAGYGLLFSELLTSQLHATVVPYESMKQLESEVHRFLPDEIIMLQHHAMHKYVSFFKQRGFFTTECSLEFNEQLVSEESAWIAEQFDQHSAELLLHHKPVLHAAIVWKKYVQKNQSGALQHFKTVQWHEPESFLTLDAATQHNLDIIKNSYDGSRSYTLLSHMDKAMTPMGSRMIKQWLLAPLMDLSMIQARHDCIQALLSNYTVFESLKRVMVQCGDMQRLVGRIALNKAYPQEYSSLATQLSLLPQIQYYLGLLPSSLAEQCYAELVDLSSLQRLLEQSCARAEEYDGIIKPGFDEELDHMRHTMQYGTRAILDFEALEQERTGIKSLKIRSNSLQGYYIEVTQKYADVVPEDYIQQQSLVQCRRYTHTKLQALQHEISQAESLFYKKEKEIFESIKERCRMHSGELRQVSHVLAIVDALLGFAYVAYEQGYVRPVFNTDGSILIQKGKHPMVSEAHKKSFIPNDTALTSDQTVWIITGPNMGGKSTYLRQVALLCIMAQAGSFVPAMHADVPILDRIFTRIGAGDHVAQGKSTFLVEMEEAAHICSFATEKSLVILDEVGRGTSTYDGLALAQAIVEYIVLKLKARCLFATHYHELALLEKEHASIASYYMKSKKTDVGIVFLHELVRGVAQSSFGIEVAKLARLPYDVIKRAEDILKQIDHRNIVVGQPSMMIQPAQHDRSHDIFIKKLSMIDLDTMSPRQAWEYLEQISKDIKQIL